MPEGEWLEESLRSKERRDLQDLRDKDGDIGLFPIWPAEKFNLG